MPTEHTDTRNGALEQPNWSRIRSLAYAVRIQITENGNKKLNSKQITVRIHQNRICGVQNDVGRFLEDGVRGGGAN